MSRDPGHLHPDLQHRFNSFLMKCKEVGIDVLVTCTYRSNQEQAALYEQGRTKPGPVVTWARPGESKHNYEIAGQPASKTFDMVPLRNGKLIWGTSGNGIDDDPTDDLIDDLELWQRVGRIAESCGLKWAGWWPKEKREFPHCEID